MQVELSDLSLLSKQISNQAGRPLSLNLRTRNFYFKIRLNKCLKSFYAKIQLNIFNHTIAIKEKHNRQNSVFQPVHAWLMLL